MTVQITLKFIRHRHVSRTFSRDLNGSTDQDFAFRVLESPLRVVQITRNSSAWSTSASGSVGSGLCISYCSGDEFRYQVYVALGTTDPRLPRSVSA